MKKKGGDFGKISGLFELSTFCLNELLTVIPKFRIGLGFSAMDKHLGMFQLDASIWFYDKNDWKECVPLLERLIDIGIIKLWRIVPLKRFNSSKNNEEVAEIDLSRVSTRVAHFLLWYIICVEKETLKKFRRIGKKIRVKFQGGVFGKGGGKGDLKYGWLKEISEEMKGWEEFEGMGIEIDEFEKFCIRIS